MESFKELALPAFLHESLDKMKFDKPTPVQAQAIPPALEGKDLIASAETGSGKTAAFGIPMLTYLTNQSSKTALIMTPTRELAEQVDAVLKQLSGGRHDLRTALLIGGMGMDKQTDALRRGARLFIGTPGRINDHIEQQNLNLARTGFLVLDEADRMLDMGFSPQLDKIRKWLIGPRQTMLFSATIPPDIERIAALYLTNPVRITVGTNSKPVDRIQQKILHTSHARKFDNLLVELKKREGSILIFGRTQQSVDQLAQRLKEKHLGGTYIHGGLSQDQRRAALDLFKDGKVRVLVATDIAARGLDIQNIAHVINYDLPYVPEDYVHRIGRTGRAGAEGDSLTFLTPDDGELWGAILKELGTAQSAIQVLPGHFGEGGEDSHAEVSAPAVSPAPQGSGDRHRSGGGGEGRRSGGGQYRGGRHQGQGSGQSQPVQAPGSGSQRPGGGGEARRSGGGEGHRQGQDGNRPGGGGESRRSGGGEAHRREQDQDHHRAHQDIPERHQRSDHSSRHRSGPGGGPNSGSKPGSQDRHGSGSRDRHGNESRDRQSSYRPETGVVGKVKRWFRKLINP